MAIVAIVFVNARVVAPILKILLDIFRYVGGDSYRKNIQLHLDSIIRVLSIDSGAGKSVVILSHSLGTVIALNSLLSSEEWAQDARITLITLGSPIRRFFMRFFPGLFFPATIAAAADAVAERVADFRWINCYRPFDQVGAALGLSGLTNARDISTNQWRRIWNAHPNYWGDDLVLKSIARAMLETPMHSTVLQAQRERPASRRYVVTEWVDAAEKFRQRLTTQIIYFAAIAFLAAPLVATAVVAWTTYSRSMNSAAAAHFIETSGIDTLATVDYQTEWSPNQHGGHRTYKYTITYMSADGKDHRPPPIEHWDGLQPFEEATYEANMDTLSDYAKKHCPNPWGDLGGSVQTAFKFSPPCRLDGVRLRYARDHPELWVLPAFPPQRTWWDTLRDSAWQTFVTFLTFGAADWGIAIFVGPALIAMIAAY